MLSDWCQFTVVGEENGKPVLRLREKWQHERFGSAARSRVRAVETVIRKHIGSISYSASLRVRTQPHNGNAAGADFRESKNIAQLEI
jgi:hypothetical protein